MGVLLVARVAGHAGYRSVRPRPRRCGAPDSTPLALTTCRWSDAPTSSMRSPSTSQVPFACRSRLAGAVVHTVTGRPEPRVGEFADSMRPRRDYRVAIAEHAGNFARARCQDVQRGTRQVHLALVAGKKRGVSEMSVLVNLTPKPAPVAPPSPRGRTKSTISPRPCLHERTLGTAQLAYPQHVVQDRQVSAGRAAWLS